MVHADHRSPFETLRAHPKHPESLRIPSDPNPGGRGIASLSTHNPDRTTLRLGAFQYFSYTNASATSDQGCLNLESLLESLLCTTVQGHRVSRTYDPTTKPQTGFLESIRETFGRSMADEAFGIQISNY